MSTTPTFGDANTNDDALQLMADILCATEIRDVQSLITSYTGTIPETQQLKALTHLFTQFAHLSGRIARRAAVVDPNIIRGLKQSDTPSQNSSHAPQSHLRLVPPLDN